MFTYSGYKFLLSYPIRFFKELSRSPSLERVIAFRLPKTCSKWWGYRLECQWQQMEMW